MDVIEKNLKDMADRLWTAWQNNQCLTCPLGELSALATATLIFYQEHTKRQRAEPWMDHWTNYRKIHK